MLQRFLLITLTLCSLTASAQWQQTGSKVRYVNGLGIPTKDTAAGVAADSSQLVIRPQDSALYIKYKRTWLRVGGGGGSISGSGTTNYVSKFTSATALGNSQIFDNGTNVGIGTATPAYKLDVVGGNGDGIQYRTSTRAIGIGQISNEATLFWGSSTPLIFFAGSELMRITSAGNVGISEGNAPTQVLNIYRSGSTQTVMAAGNSNTGLNGTYFGVNTAGNGIMNTTGAFASIFTTNGVERMRITSAGDVGIGYTAPAAKLSVSGTTLINTNTDNGVDKLQVSGSMNVSTLATTNNLSVTTNATVGGTLNVSGTTTLGTTNTGAINASSVSASSGNGSFGNLYSSGILETRSISVKYRNISATYTVTTNDDYFINVTSGTFTINLPTAATPYTMIYVIKNSGAGTVTLDPFSTQTIDGSTTITMNVQNQTYTIIGDGTNWKIVSKYL